MGLLIGIAFGAGPAMAASAVVVALKGGKPLAIDSIPKIVASEVIHDMESLANAAANPGSSRR